MFVKIRNMVLLDKCNKCCLHFFTAPEEACYWTCDRVSNINGNLYQCANCINDGCVKSLGGMILDNVYRVDGVCYRANSGAVGCLVSNWRDACISDGRISVVACPSDECTGMCVCE